MSDWQRLGVFFAGWIAVDVAAVLAWVGWCEYATRRDARRQDKPIRQDDTMLRLERAAWNQGENH